MWRQLHSAHVQLWTVGGKTPERGGPPGED